MPRTWTEEQKKRQSLAIRRWQPWKDSTGPRTKRGKNQCKMNATKHGYRSRGFRELCEALRAQARFVREMRQALIAQTRRKQQMRHPASGSFYNVETCNRPLIYGVNEGILLSGRSVRFLIHENHKNFRPVRSGAMSIHKKIFSKIFRGCLMSATALSLASIARASSEQLLQPDSDWAVSKISTSQQAGGGAYCALARRFNNDTVLTFARNAKDESSIAIDFQNDGALDRNTNYYVSIKPGAGSARSFNVHPVSGRALVVRLGKDYAFYDALSRAAQLDVKVAADSYSFTMSDFSTGQEQLNGCLSDLIEPASGPPAQSSRAEDVPPPAAMPAVPVMAARAAAPPGLVVADTVTPHLAVSSTDLIRAPVSDAGSKTQAASDPAADAPAANDDLNHQIEVLHEENIRLRNALETERQNYEGSAVLEDKNSSIAAELNEKISMLQRENDDLRHQLSDKGLATGSAGATSADLKSLQDENRKLHDEIDHLHSESAQKVADTGKKSDSDKKLKEVQAKLDEADKRNADADRKLADARHLADEAAASESKKAGKTAEARTAADEKMKVAQLMLEDAKHKAAEADKKMAEADRKLAEAGTKAVASSRSAKEEAKSAAAVLSMRKKVASLEAENASLKDSLRKSLASAKTSYISEDTEVSDSRLHVLTEKLAKVQAERDMLSHQVETLMTTHDRNLINISSSNWNLEQATKRYNEAEREVSRLGQQVEESRTQCEADKKKIEYQLFDPAIASKQQVEKLNGLQQALEKASADLMIERDKVALLQAKLNAEQAAAAVPVAAVAPATAPVIASAETPAVPDAAPAVAVPAVPVVSVGKTSAPPPPSSAPTALDTAMIDQPMPVAGVPAVEANEAQPAKPVLDAKALIDAPVKAPPRPLPDPGMMTADDLRNLLSPDVAISGDIKRVDGPAGTIAYNWKAGALFGSAEQQKMSSSNSSGGFDALVSKYLARTKARCLGTFAAKPGDTHDAGGIKSSEYEIACVGDAGNISASVLFFSHKGIFTAIAHEGSVDDMDDAMDIRDRLATKILQTKLAAN